MDRNLFIVIVLLVVAAVSYALQNIAWPNRYWRIFYKICMWAIILYCLASALCGLAVYFSII